MIETEGLTHIHLRVGDLERSLRFYQHVFGMREKFRDGDLVFLNTPVSVETITVNPHDEGLAGQSTHGAISSPPANAQWQARPTGPDPAWGSARGVQG